MYIPSNTNRRYGNSYGSSHNKMLRVAGACCPTKRCGCGGKCGCNGGTRYSANTPGAASGQSATMMMPNIVINVQSGNRKSNDYTDAHNASTSYSPSEANPTYYAPTSSENNPIYSSYEHSGYYSGRYNVDSDSVPTPTSNSGDVVPIILSPRATAKARQQQSGFNPGVPPENVGRRYPLEFP